jgi:ATP-dependent Clp protease ATP-binding subunit ClpA
LKAVLGGTVFDQFSDRSRLVVFLARKDAGRRGAATLEVAHLLEALVREDQGEVGPRFPGALAPSAAMSPQEPYFSAEVASEILLRLEEILPPQSKPVPDSTDMPTSAALDLTFTEAMELAKQLHHGRIEPLHLLMAVLSQEPRAAEIVKQLGVSKEAVLAAIRM